MLSQNGKHWKAADIGDKVIHRLFECFHIKMAVVKEILSDLKKSKKGKHKNGVDFKKIVLNDAKEKLKHLSEFEKSYELIEDST